MRRTLLLILLGMTALWLRTACRRPTEDLAAYHRHHLNAHGRGHAR